MNFAYLHGWVRDFWITFCRRAQLENKGNRVLLTMWRGQISLCSPGDQELKTPQERFGEHYGELCIGEENGHCGDLVVNAMVACCFGSCHMVPAGSRQKMENICRNRKRSIFDWSALRKDQSAPHFKMQMGSTCVGIHTQPQYLRTATFYIHRGEYKHSWGDVYCGILQKRFILRVRRHTRNRATHQLNSCNFCNLRGVIRAPLCKCKRASFFSKISKNLEIHSSRSAARCKFWLPLSDPSQFDKMPPCCSVDAELCFYYANS